MTTTELVSLDDYVRAREGNVAACARELDVDYMKLWRWYSRKNYAHEAERREMAAKGIALPVRSRGK